MSYPLPSLARLHRKKEFEALYRSGRRLRGKTLDAVVGKQSNELGTARLGISVPARVGKAVVRNRLRRLVRECFRRSLPEMRKTVDIIVIIRSGDKKIRRAAIEDEFRNLLSRAGIL